LRAPGLPLPAGHSPFQEIFSPFECPSIQANLPQSVEVASLDARVLPKRVGTSTSAQNLRCGFIFSVLYRIPVVHT
jgi:hypothetical protein